MKKIVNRERAFTIFEILVAIACLAILAGISWLVMAPGMKVKGIETQIRNDLRQITVAINAYRIDHDDQLPLRMESLPANVPREFPDWIKYRSLSSSSSGTHGLYYYAQSWTNQRREQLNRATLRHLFDPAKNAIAKAPFYARKHGEEEFELHTGSGSFRTAKRESHLTLGSFLDGHIAWVRYFEPYEDEQAALPVPVR